MYAFMSSYIWAGPLECKTPEGTFHTSGYAMQSMCGMYKNKTYTNMYKNKMLKDLQKMK